METSVCVNGIKKNYFYLIIKRFFDILFSLIGCVGLLILIIPIKLISMLNNDFDSIFYSQDRIGRDGRIFKLYKFRSMAPNADEILEELLKDDELREEYNVNKKLNNDPRITKIGKLMRKTSIDELPQMINVIKGDMSFIGNRPYMLKEKDDMGNYFENIIISKPGISGYWQVNGRSNTTFLKRLEMEEWYSLNRGLRLDIKLFFKTFLVVLFKDDAK